MGVSLTSFSAHSILALVKYTRLRSFAYTGAMLLVLNSNSLVKEHNCVINHRLGAIFAVITSGANFLAIKQRLVGTQLLTLTYSSRNFVRCISDECGSPEARRLNGKRCAYLKGNFRVKEVRIHSGTMFEISKLTFRTNNEI